MIRVALLGGGMIAHDQLLPALYQLQRHGLVGEIDVCARRESTLRSLAEAPGLLRAFPGHSFRQRLEPYRQVIAELPPQSLVIVGLPDQLHHDAVMAALEADQHVICVKPLVRTLAEAHEIERTAKERGLFVGVEYHKRLDDRSLMARRAYQAGRFGEFKLGTAALMEKWYYRHSNFQEWCTVENSDAFSYIGCHYVDLVHFITGLQPTAVSVYGIQDKYPNGNVGWLWTDARVLWENGACLNVQNSLCFPDAAPGSNTQGLTMYCSDGTQGALIRHNDQYRGVEHSYVNVADSPGATQYAQPSPDYMAYVDLGGPGLVPVGYGYRSVELLVRKALAVREPGQIEARQQLLSELDAQGVVATPANSRFNEAVIEAARQSIARNGELVACREQVTAE